MVRRRPESRGEEKRREEKERKKERRMMDILKDFQRLFFSMSRLTSFPWTVLEENLQSNRSSEFISEILKQGVSSVGPIQEALPLRAHQTACDPLDELYDALAEVIGAEDAGDCYKSYLLPCGEAVSLSESVALISEGTTGLVTWDAALHLAEWALDHRHTFTGRTVLELGSGVGLTGITICRSCSPSRFVFSDCHPGVLHKLRANVRLNGLDERQAPAVSVEHLDWTAATEEKLREIGPDVVIAADVVYDPDVVVSLVTLLSKILRRSTPEVLVCSTVRNPETYGGFKLQLENAGLRHHVITGAGAHVFPYNRLSTIELIRLHT
ncbi:hypothetical protein F2P81_015493 [Scophthalmus maximus]|uniref:FAM86 N-terminal domain-containing protein n=1 Tax=Scophthalmus maximus TaxID=52904 RepID=A0A6A4SGD9_SCOMX|nr:hypothetical protein F2P81_015493 [Scophthalmus maximus]